MSIEFKHHELPNGLTVIGEINPDAHTAAAGFFVKVGTRDETSPIMGVSHFLEHMMFKGTPRRSADEVNRDFDRIGANYNASTSQEVTCYWAHVLPEFIPDALDILADILRPALRAEDFDMEKNVILEEIGMYEDRPFWKAYEAAMETYFAGHPLGWRILGTADSIRNLKRDDMLEYFRERYSPNNMVVSLAGRIDFNACVDQLARMCGAWPRTGAQRDHAPPQSRRADRSVADQKLKNHYVVSVMPGPSRQDELRYAAAVLANILGDSEGSRLYWKLIDPGLAEEVNLDHQGFDSAGTFLCYASCSTPNGKQVEAIINEVLDHAAEGVTTDEIERAANKIAMDITLYNERPAGHMMALGGQWIYTGEYRSLHDELKRVLAVDVDAVRAVCEQFDFTQRTTVRCSPAGPASG